MSHVEPPFASAWQTLTYFSSLPLPQAGHVHDRRTVRDDPRLSRQHRHLTPHARPPRFESRALGARCPRRHHFPSPLSKALAVASSAEARPDPLYWKHWSVSAGFRSSLPRLSGGLPPVAFLTRQCLAWPSVSLPTTSPLPRPLLSFRLPQRRRRSPFLPRRWRSPRRSRTRGGCICPNRTCCSSLSLASERSTCLQPRVEFRMWTDFGC